MIVAWMTTQPNLNNARQAEIHDKTKLVFLPERDDQSRGVFPEMASFVLMSVCGDVLAIRTSPRQRPRRGFFLAKKRGPVGPLSFIWF